MFYTYEQIQNIRNDLYNLVAVFEKPGFIAPPSLLHDVQGLKKELHHYDTLLNELGRGNVCRDFQLCRAFDKTKNLISTIKIRAGII